MSLLKRNNKKTKKKETPATLSPPIKSSRAAEELRYSQKRTILSSLRCTPPPGWIALRNGTIFALCRTRPHQNYWSPIDIGDIGLQSEVFGAYVLQESEGLPMYRAPDIPPIMTSHVASVLYESEYIELRRNIGLEPCVLYGDKTPAKNLMKHAEKELLEQTDIGVWSRYEQDDEITEDDIMRMLSLGMELDNSQGGFVGMDAESANIVGDGKIAAEIRQHANVGVLCYSMTKTDGDNLCEIGLQSGLGILPHLDSINNSYISVPQPDGTLESIIEPYSIILYSRPQLVAQGLRSPSLSQRSTEIIYLLKALNEQDMPSDAESISQYLSTRASPFDAISTENLILQTQATLGENNMGEQRLYQDENGNWKHTLPAVRGEEEDVLGDEQWVWRHMVTGAFQEIAENIPELSTG